jgi:hypothetical protein
MVSSRPILSRAMSLTCRVDNNDCCADIHPFDLDHRLQNMIVQKPRSLFVVNRCMHAK